MFTRDEQNKLKKLMRAAKTGQYINVDDQDFLANCYLKYPNEYAELKQEVDGDVIRSINPLAK